MLPDTHAAADHRGRPVAPSRGRLRPLGLADVTIEDGFWAEPQHRNGTTMIEHAQSWMERLGWIGNFDAAVEGRLPADRRGSSPTRRSTSCSRRSPGSRRAPATPRWRSGSARSRPGSPARRSPTATSTRCSAGPASSRATATCSGATSSTATGT